MSGRRTVSGFIHVSVCSNLSKPGYELACHLNGCLAGTCSSNYYWGVHPHYGTGCAGTPATHPPCSKQTDMPATCCCVSYFNVGWACHTSHNVNGLVVSCGPDANQTRHSTTFHGCSPATGLLRASVNPAWADAVYGTNPYSYGHVWAQITN